jgi:hypothetical protein
MKNIQIIDGALNCTFSIFQASEDEFRAIFPALGQDIEFAEAFVRRVGKKKAAEIWTPIWERPIRKQKAKGVDGTLFFGFSSRRKYFPKSKKEEDWNPSSINAAQRKLYAKDI